MADVWLARLRKLAPASEVFSAQSVESEFGRLRIRGAFALEHLAIQPDRFLTIRHAN